VKTGENYLPGAEDWSIAKLYGLEGEKLRSGTIRFQGRGRESGSERKGVYKGRDAAGGTKWRKEAKLGKTRTVRFFERSGRGTKLDERSHQKSVSQVGRWALRWRKEAWKLTRGEKNV